MPCILNLICNTEYDEEHDAHLRSILKQASLNEALNVLILKVNSCLKKSCTEPYQYSMLYFAGSWFYWRKHQISNEKYSVNTMLSTWSSRVQSLSEKKQCCGNVLSTAYASSFIHFANCVVSHNAPGGYSGKPVTAVLNGMLTCMGQLVLLRSKTEKTSVEKRMWTSCIKECISTFYFVNQHIEGNECDEWHTLNQNLCKKISALFSSFVKASLKYGYFDQTITGI